MAVNQIKAGAVLSYLSIGLSNIVGILYTPFMLRMLGQSEYGMFSLAASVVGYLTILDMGFGNAIVRYTAQYRAENKEEKQWALFGMFVLFYGIIGLITLSAGTVLYFNVDTLFSKTMDIGQLHQMQIMVLLMVVNLAVSFVFGISGSIITAYQCFVWQQLINIVRIVLQPCIMIIILLLGYKAVAMIVIMTIMNLCVLGINCWFCISKLKIKIHFDKWDKKLFKEVCGYSFFIFIGSIIDKLYWSTGQFILGIYTGTIAVAIYAVAIQLKGYYMSFANTLSTLFLPKVTSMIACDIPESRLSDLFIRVGRIQFIVLGFIMFGFIAFGKLFIYCWAGEDYSSSYSIALILMLPLSIPLLGHGIVMNVYYCKVIHLDVIRFWKEILRMMLPICWLPFPTLYLLNIRNVQSWGGLMAGVAVFSLFYLGILYKFSLNTEERMLIAQPFHKIKQKIMK